MATAAAALGIKLLPALPRPAPKPLARSTLRRAPPRPRTFGFKPFRLVVSASGRLHVYGPDGRDEQLSAFAEEMRGAAEDVVVALRTINAVLNVVNLVLEEKPAARSLLVTSVKTARDLYRKYVWMRGWRFQKGRRQNDGQFVITGDDARSYENAITVLSLSRLYQFLQERDEFDAQDPMRMDPKYSRMSEGQSRLVETQQGKVTVDTDLLFRTPQAGRTTPRTNRPFFLEEILKAGDEAGWPSVVRTLVLAKGRSGGRDFQLRLATVYQWLVMGGGDWIHVPNKYSSGRIEIRLRVAGIRDELAGLMDATYPELGGYAGLLELAAHPTKRAVLKRLFIFTIDRERPVSYGYVNDCWFRPIMERMGMFHDFGDGNADIRTRWVTMHWLRHEFTNSVLQRIDESGLTRKEKLYQHVLLARYMGWKSARAMLEYYGGWFFNREVDEFIAVTVDAANDNSLPMHLEVGHGPSALTDAELARARTHMGGLFRICA
jgi:hypothetical protein